MNRKNLMDYLKKNHLIIILFLIFGFFFLGNNFTDNNFKSSQFERSDNFKISSGTNYENYEQIYTTFKLNSYDVEKKFNGVLKYFEEKNYLILNKNLYLEEKYENGNINIKVQKKNYDNFLSNFEKKFDIDGKNIRISNVKEQYEDYNERISRYEFQIKKYVELLKKNSSINEEVLINSRIDEIEDKLFYIKKNFKNLGENIEYVNIQINFYNDNPFKKIDIKSFGEIIAGFISGFLGFIFLFFNIFGWILIPIIFYFLYKIFLRKKN